ncbi:hypothetical protein ACFE04_024646 [Oxalis oulophora]
MGSISWAYSLPVALFSLFVFYQLLVLPRTFVPSHYDALGIQRFSSVETVEAAYKNISFNWDSGLELPTTHNFIKIRHAYELLKNPIWKRDYDLFDIDHHLHFIQTLQNRYATQIFSHVDLPLLNAAAVSELGDQAFNVITTDTFQSMFQNANPCLLQVYSSGSNQSAHFFNSWRRIATLLSGVANTGMVELGETKLAMYLAEKKPTGKYFFRSGVPSLVAFPSGCRSADCLVRYEGELTIDGVTDWFATSILNLPRIFFYSKETLGPNFLAKSGPHKVRVIFFSKTGERATPFVRQAVKNYGNYASFAYVLWREEDSAFWWNTFEVESAPAVVFLKDPGLKPVVYHEFANETQLLDILEKNKQHELPQLRSINSMELGCDARGYSRAGYASMTWYCVIVAGRLSPELNQMRETVRKVQQTLSNTGELIDTENELSSSTAAVAVNNKRLTFAWLDGEAQQKYCSFYVHSETSYETCGPRVPTDVPAVFIVRYKRNSTEETTNTEKKPKSPLAFNFEEPDPAAQLVVRYNGTEEVTEIINWVSKIVEDGDTMELPFYRAKTPELLPEDSDPIWSRGAQRVISKSVGMKQRVRNIANDYLQDPRTGSFLLLGALISFATIWFRSNQPAKRPPAQSSESNENAQPTSNEKARLKRRSRAEKASNTLIPPSLTDEEPKDAYQMPFSDSDSE